MEAQHTLQWYRARLGNITGSMVGLLMKSSKSDVFSDTGKSYIYAVSAERDMNPAIVDNDKLFTRYIQQVDITSKAMRFGTEQEEDARALYEDITGHTVEETGSCLHATIKHFASSPDGIVRTRIPDKLGLLGILGVLEIKCPSQAVYMRYCDEVRDNASLLSTEPKYYYQCQAHMMVTSAAWCDFVVYCPFQQHPIHIVRIVRDEPAMKKMEERINMANDMINQIIDAA